MNYEYSYQFKDAMVCVTEESKHLPVSHMLAVCASVIDAGGDEDEAIAALMHNHLNVIKTKKHPLYEKPRDWEGCKTHADVIDSWWGSEVAEILEYQADGIPDGYIDRLSNAPAAAILVSCADKLHELKGYAMAGLRWSGSEAKGYIKLRDLYERCDRIPETMIDEMNLWLNVLAG